MNNENRIAVVSEAMKNKHYDMTSGSDFHGDRYFSILAEEALKALDEYYGTARYWMSAEFAKESVLIELEKTIDRIRNASFHA